MSREWKPGDVAMIDQWRIFCHEDFDPEKPVRWTFTDGSSAQVAATHMRNARPLVVIDPENREQVERLVRAYFADFWARPAEERDRDGGQQPKGVHFDAMQAALREFATPTPPRPEEPTGLGAVVEDAEGERWVRVTVENETWPGECWQDRFGADDRWTKWGDIDAVRILSEGWSE